MNNRFFTIAGIGILFACCILFYGNQTLAANAASWQSGRIIDDGTFTNSLDMSVSQIQDFLNQKTATGGNGRTPGQCDSAGLSMSELGGGTRAQYGAAHNNPAPFTCLKDYYEVPKTFPAAGVPASNYGGKSIPNGAQSSAQIIWGAARQYSISPRVLLVTLQKESVGPLVTDDWPFQAQYTYAMGAHCPDGPNGAQCDSDYAGFSIQMYDSARLFRYYLDNMQQPWWTYAKPYQNNQIRWNTQYSSFSDAAGNAQPCGSGSVYIQTRATVALYTYTPYQPNQAALNNLYGSAPSGVGFDGRCATYGNRNFWRIFTDWFGSTTTDIYPISVETAIGGDGKYYLVVGNTKRWIPTGDIYNDWNLSSYPLLQVSQASIDQISTIPNLDRLGLTKEGDYVLVSGGKKWYLTDMNLVRAWGYGNNMMLASPMFSTLAAMPSGGQARPFLQDASTSSTYALSAGMLDPIASSALGSWNVGNAVSMSTAGISAYQTGSQLSIGMNIASQKYIVDQGSALLIPPSLASSYDPLVKNYVSVDPSLLSIFNVVNALPVVHSSDSGNWQLLINGKLHYVLNTTILSAWGYDIISPQALSPALITQFGIGPPLGVTVQSSVTGKYYFLDGMKHEVESSVVPSWIGAGASMQLPDTDITPASGAALNTVLIQKLNTPHIYTVINGAVFHIPNGKVLNGYGYQIKYPLISINANGIDSLPFAGEVSQFVINMGTTYYLQDGIAYSISPTAVQDWTANIQLHTYTNTDFTSRLTPQSVNLSWLTQHADGSVWLASGGSQLNVSNYADAYGFSSPTSFTAINMEAQTLSASYLVRSTNYSDSRIWLVSGGKKYWISDGAHYAAYSANGLSETPLSNTVLASFPDATATGEPSVFVTTQNSGVKYLANGKFFAFPDGITLVNVTGQAPVLNLSPSVYASLSQLAGTVTRLIKDTQTQMVYYMQNGTRNWITNGQAFKNYMSIPLTDVGHADVLLIPQGPNIN